jgi:endogenous inhibitor of DNA gyrase (YacG/DUF329 family)
MEWAEEEERRPMCCWGIFKYLSLTCLFNPVLYRYRKECRTEMEWAEEEERRPMCSLDS